MSRCVARTRDFERCRNHTEPWSLFCRRHRWWWLITSFGAIIAVTTIGANIAQMFGITFPSPLPLPVNTPAQNSSTPAFSSNSVRLIPIGDQNIVVKLESQSLVAGDVIPLNETITVMFKILNNSTVPVTISTLVIGSRGPGVGCENKNSEKWSAPDNPFPTQQNITIQPGETYEYQGSRAYYLPGKYFLEPIVQAPGGKWGGIQPFSCFTLTVGAAEQSKTKTLSTPPSEVETPTESQGPVPTENAQKESLVAIIEVKPSSGDWVHADSSQCLWTNATGPGAFVELILVQEVYVSRLRISLFDPFVRRVRFTFSDNSQQTKGLDEIKDYAFQDIRLQPVITSRIKVEVLEVQDNAYDNFGICHIEVFGTPPVTAEKPSSGLAEIFPQAANAEEYTFQDQVFSREYVSEDYCTRTAPYGLKLNYQMQKEEDFGGWGTQWLTTGAQHFVATDFSAFSFWVRGFQGGETFQIVFVDDSGAEQSIKIHEIVPITTTWQEIRVDLNRVDLVNLASISSIDFAFYGRDGIGSVCVDDIAFLR